MRLLVLFPLLGLALSAPLLEENEAEKKSIVKRSEEGIGFGNQQNLPKIKKKSDPAMLADNAGSVLAETPQELTPEDHDENGDVMQESDSGNSADSAARVEEELNSIIKEEQMAQQVAEEEAGGRLPGGDEESETPIVENTGSIEGSNGGADTEENEVEVVNPEEVAAAVAAAEEPQQEALLQNNGISPENNEAIKELMQENMVGSEPVDDDEGDNAQEQFAEVVDAPEGPARQDSGAEQSLEMLENPLEAYRLYKNYQNFLSTYPEYYSNAYGNYQNGRRRRASSPFMSRLRNREIKRNHRIKRELPYGDSSLFPYFYPEQEQEQEDAMYRVLPEQEVLGNDPYTLFPEEALEEELAAEEGLPYADDEDEEEYGTPVLYDGKMGYFLPSKRQDMLSFVPGNKRESYFFPFSKEPETHYKAFVPEKRNYLESYGDLVRLARALAMEPQDREQYLQGYEWE